MKNRGFTMIELLVVISIISVLSSVVIVSINSARVKGYDAQRVSNLRSVQMAIEMYANDNGGKYPSTNGVWYSACSTLGTQTTQNGAIPGLVPNYIKQLPLDSQTDGGSLCCYAYDSPIGGADYKYMFYNCPSSLACYGSTEAGSGLGDPNRSTSACAVYTTNAQGL